MQNLGGYPLRDRLRGEGLKAGGALFIVSGPRKPFGWRRSDELRTVGGQSKTSGHKPDMMIVTLLSILFLTLPEVCGTYLDLLAVALLVFSAAVAAAIRYREALITAALTSPRLSKFRLRAATAALESMLGPVDVREVVFSSERIVLLGLTVPNPSIEGVCWSHPTFLTAEMIEIGLASSGLSGALSLLGACSVRMCGLDIMLGCPRRHIRKLRLHGIVVRREEITPGGTTNSSLVYERLTTRVVEDKSAAEAAAPPSVSRGPSPVPEGEDDKSLREEEEEEEESLAAAAALEDERQDERQSKSKRTLRSFVGGKFRGVKDAMVREGLAWACGDVVSRIISQPEYTIREHDAARAAHADAQTSLQRFVSVDHLIISSVTLMIGSMATTVAANGPDGRSGLSNGSAARPACKCSPQRLSNGPDGRSGAGAPEPSGAAPSSSAVATESSDDDEDEDEDEDAKATSTEAETAVGAPSHSRGLHTTETAVGTPKPSQANTSHQKPSQVITSHQMPSETAFGALSTDAHYDASATAAPAPAPAPPAPAPAPAAAPRRRRWLGGAVVGAGLSTKPAAANMKQSAAEPSKRTLQMEGPLFELRDFEGSVERLGALVLAGSLERLLRAQLFGTRRGSERRVRELARQQQQQQQQPQQQQPQQQQQPSRLLGRLLGRYRPVVEESAVSGAIEGAPAAVSRELSPVPDGECLLQSMIQAQEDDEEEEESKGGTAAAAEGASSAAHGAPGTARTPLDSAPSKKRPISSAISTGVPGVVGMAKRRLGIVGFSSANARPVHLQAA